MKKEKRQQKKKISWQQVLTMGLFMAIGGVAGLMIGSFAGKTMDEGGTLGDIAPTVISLILGLYAAMYLHIALHEAGHLLFGLLSGYGFSSYRVGSFMVVKESGKLRFRRLSIAGTGGQCLMTPPELVDGKMPYVLYNLGGCIVNVAMGLVCLLVGFTLREGSLWRMLMMISAAVGFGFGLVNGIPMNMGAVNNDGQNALSLGKDPAALRSFWVQMKINETIARGIRLKDMPEEWFAIPEESQMGNAMVASLAVFATNRYMDAQEFDKAAELLEHLIEMESGITGLHKGMMICDLAYCEMIGQNRPEKLERLQTKEQKQFMKSMKTFPTVVRTEYAYALLQEKDMKKAEKLQGEFEKLAKNYPYPSDIQSERELMEIAAGKRPNPLAVREELG